MAFGSIFWDVNGKGSGIKHKTVPKNWRARCLAHKALSSDRADSSRRPQPIEATWIIGRWRVVELEDAVGQGGGAKHCPVDRGQRQIGRGEHGETHIWVFGELEKKLSWLGHREDVDDGCQKCGDDHGAAVRGRIPAWIGRHIADDVGSWYVHIDGVCRHLEHRALIVHTASFQGFWCGAGQGWFGIDGLKGGLAWADSLF